MAILSTLFSTINRRGLIDSTKDIHSLTTFRRESAVFLKQLKKHKRPMVRTVKARQRPWCRTLRAINGYSILPLGLTFWKGFGRVSKRPNVARAAI